MITPQANQTPNDFEFYGLAILSRESKTLSGANLSAYLNGSIIASKLAQAGITLQNSAIYRYEKLHIIVPTKSLNCSLDFYSHFAHTRADICYFSNETPTIALNLSNRTNTTITIQLHFFDNQTNSSYANKQILLTYTNQTINLTTDQDGNAETTFNYSKNSPFVFAEFKTDLETKSEKATLPIPA